MVITSCNKKSQSNLGRVVSPPLTAENNYVTNPPLVTRGFLTFTPQNCSFSSTISTQSNAPVPGPTPLTTPNGIQIQSAVYSQLTYQTKRQTDRQPTDRCYRRQVCSNTRLHSSCRYVALVVVVVGVVRVVIYHLNMLPIGYVALWIMIVRQPRDVTAIHVLSLNHSVSRKWRWLTRSSFN